MELTNILWMFMIGSSAAIIAVYYNAHFLGGLVRALIQIDATTPETAISADELGIKMTPVLKYALRPGSNFSQTVIKTDDNKYYIAPEKLDMAKSKYRSKDTTLIFVLLSILILLLVTLALSYIFPDIVENFSNQLSGIFGEGK